MDDGSTQNMSAETLAKIKAEIDDFECIHLVKNQGKGYATRKGVEHTSAQNYIYTDIDFPYQDEDLAAIYEKLQEGGDLIIAKRSEEYYQQVSKGRTWISKRFKGLILLLFNIPTTDTQAGLKGLSPAAKNILLQTQTKRYLFDLELVKLCAKQGLKLIELPVKLKEGVVLSKVSYRILFTEIFNLFRILFR